MQTLTQICDAVEDFRNRPHDLAELLLSMSVKYSRMSEIYKDLRQSKQVYWKANKEGKSDKAVEIDWHCTPEGEKELRANTELKALEKLMSSTKTYLRHLENESRNLY